MPGPRRALLSTVATLVLVASSSLAMPAASSSRHTAALSATTPPSESSPRPAPPARPMRYRRSPASRFPPTPLPPFVAPTRSPVSLAALDPLLPADPTALPGRFVVPLVPLGPLPPDPVRPELAVAAREAAPSARLGIQVLDRDSGRTVVEWEPEQQFASQSLVKLLLAVDWLHTHGPPDAARRYRLGRMLAVSDDSVADELWSTNGGPEIVDRMSELVGLRGTTPPADPTMWGDTRTTAADMVALYRYLLERAPPAHRALVLDALGAFAPSAADGFDQAFGIPTVARGQHWVVKQGWACCLPGYSLHTTGVVGANNRFVVAVLSEHPTAGRWSAAVAAVNAATAALVPALAAS
ncbi:serine hydrolase [Streptoalloteichus hindustanus]|uniref:Beta-lactamase class A n=1 Tax=Streptoalloteichus hindustanus TaxID=2017 RepID=A0A1M4XJB2_STRHI|nr:serine hydrolase [Streptoalloteichus hindustanus]SHE93478.1 Beta-lactamase class A [Streptoalloteichus hindustanus]